MMGINKKEKRKICILCEGKIEKNYFSSYKKHHNFEDLVLEVKELPKADYKSTKNYLLKNPYLGIPFIILDLDRLKDSNEVKAIKELTKKVKEQKGFLFVTYPNFEAWILAHFENQDLKKIFSQKSTKDIKAFLAKQNNLYEEITKRGGSLQRAIDFYSSLGLFLDRNFEFNDDCLHSSQSSLCLFHSMLLELDNK